MKKILIIGGLLLLLSTIIFWRNKLTTRVKIKDTIFSVDVAVTPKEKERGLAGRLKLKPNEGMLFTYDHKDRYPYWMRGMNFAIDILWIDDKIIVEITRNAQPESLVGTQVFQPKLPIDKVLEAASGTADKLNIQIGDTITILR